ncbi:MAG: phytoene desaturase family protein [Marivibrio sp.]|uniref:1-hydroxycarotenoid 3,4-desaturase CrtD n=1 Tax=Marivibrio sp. TaxID=2039719 RepID=UPI0032EC1093
MHGTRDRHVAVIGAGIGGLAAALDLLGRGVRVTVLERQAQPGGKMRTVEAPDGRPIDAGPTVFTMKWVFDQLFEGIEERLDDHVGLHQAHTLARHAWPEEAGGGRLDLFADVARAADAIGDFAGARDAAGFKRFVADSQAIYETLEPSFIRAPAPSMGALMKAVGPTGLGKLAGIKPFTPMWKALGAYFADPRLRQLFGRYTTYCGSSPFQAPATLMLVSHVEQAGVWLIAGGMHRLVQVMAGLVEAKGGRVLYDSPVAEITVERGRATGVTLTSGEAIAADAVIANADCAAVGGGLFGAEAARAVDAPPRAARSLSALTFLGAATARGFPLLRHTVFFSSAYEDEFARIFNARRLPHEPTVYICAQDRGDADKTGDGDGDGGDPDRPAERLLLLVNAPPDGDRAAPDEEEIAKCETRTHDLLARCGLTLSPAGAGFQTAGPRTFAELFPATGGALYGRASHGWRASFQRPGVKTRLPGLYLAGGSVHPGPGVPMAALSGRLAAAAATAGLTRDRAST